jgi:uncharacterized protein (UPF0548 family)
MFLLTKPDDPTVTQFLADRESDTFSYPEIGATLTTAPTGYNIDHNRIQLGTGSDTFERAKTAVGNWKMIELEWVKLFPDNMPIEVDGTIAILVEHFGFYSLNAVRIVYVLDEKTEIQRFGFAYGTLTEHGEIGEERFSVEFHSYNGEVWYDLYAFSRPASLLAKVGYPFSRSLQKAFARDSKLAMLNAVADPSASQRNT